MAAVLSALRAELLPDIKNYLDLTWDDDKMDSKIWDIATGGMAYLDGKIGEIQDYTQPGLPRSLLFDYIRYARDGAADIFENNYLHLILAAQNERRVINYAQKASDTSDDGYQPEF